MTQTLGELIKSQRPAPKHANQYTSPTKLSPRQIEICKMVARAMSDDEIGYELGIASETAKLTLVRARTKLKLSGSNTRVALARFVILGGDEENPFPVEPAS